MKTYRNKGQLRTATNERLLKDIISKLRVVRGPDWRGEYIAWCPFHPDGEGKPPHHPNLYVSERGFICHACDKKGGLKALAVKLGIKVNDMNDTIEAAYDYRDEEGKLLYQVVRFAGKQFKQRRPDGAGEWIWNLNGVKRVLYRLPELFPRTDEPVLIVEGEKDADRLAEEGLLTTTNSGGALKWKDEYSQWLVGRGVIIIPDNDGPGKKHAKQVARSVFKKATSIKILYLPGLEEKGDISDWLDKGNTIGELNRIIESTLEWEPSEDKDGQIPIESCGTQKPDTQSTGLVKLVLESDVELFHDDLKKPYIAIATPEGRRIFLIDSLRFTQWLSHKAWIEKGRAFGNDTIASAKGTLSGVACFEGREYQLHVRLAWHEGSIWIDLDGLRAVKVSPGRWRIVNKLPILFRSFPHQKPFPDPISGGDPWQVLKFLNVNDNHTKLLIMCFLVTALVPDIPIPALVIHGVQGSAKTTVIKFVRQLIDPSQDEYNSPPKNMRELAIAASQNRALFFDNLSTVAPWLSDAFCRAITGEGWFNRKLYADEELTILKYRIIIGFNGISLVATKPDLLDRSLIIPLGPIPPDRRVEIRPFEEGFNKAYPHLFGSLLDTLAATMEIKPGLKLEALPRMADFARWGAAAARALGRSPFDFLAAYNRNVGRQNEAAIDASSVAQLLIEYIQDENDCEKTASEWLREFNALAEKYNIDTTDRTWPKDPTRLSHLLRVIQPNLLTMGIQIEFKHTRVKRPIRIRKISDGPVVQLPRVWQGGDGNVTARAPSDENSVTNAVTQS